MYCLGYEIVQQAAYVLFVFVYDYMCEDLKFDVSCNKYPLYCFLHVITKQRATSSSKVRSIKFK